MARPSATGPKVTSLGPHPLLVRTGPARCLLSTVPNRALNRSSFVPPSLHPFFRHDTTHQQGFYCLEPPGPNGAVCYPWVPDSVSPTVQGVHTTEPHAPTDLCCMLRFPKGLFSKCSRRSYVVPQLFFTPFLPRSERCSETAGVGHQPECRGRPIPPTGYSSLFVMSFVRVALVLAAAALPAFVAAETCQAVYQVQVGLHAFHPTPCAADTRFRPVPCTFLFAPCPRPGGGGGVSMRGFGLFGLTPRCWQLETSPMRLCLVGGAGGSKEVWYLPLQPTSSVLQFGFIAQWALAQVGPCHLHNMKSARTGRQQPRAVVGFSFSWIALLRNMKSYVAARRVTVS